MDDPAAALGCQVGCRFVACFYVINYYAGPVGEFFDAVKEDDGDAFLYEGIEVVHLAGIKGEGSDQSVDAFVEKVVGVGGFFPIGLGGMADDEVIAGFCGDFFDPGEDGADELALELMDNDADGVGLLHPQVAGEAIGSIAQLLGGIHDAFAGFDIDGRMIFQTSADGSGRETKLFCNIIDRNIFFSCHGCKSKNFKKKNAIGYNITKTILYLLHVVIRH